MGKNESKLEFDASAEWSADTWGRKAPAQFIAWDDPEVTTAGVCIFTLHREPKVDQAKLKALLLEGKCFFAAIPLFTFFAHDINGGQIGDKYWSLTTCTWHADEAGYESWIAKMAPKDYFAVQISNRSIFPPKFHEKLGALGGVIAKLPGKPECEARPDGGYPLAPPGMVADEPMFVVNTVKQLPPWAAKAGSWYSIVVQTEEEELLRKIKNRLYGFRLLTHFATCKAIGKGKQGNTAAYNCLKLLSKSPRTHFLPDLMAAVAYDHEMTKQFYASEMVFKWLPWKSAKTAECMFNIALDAECSQWEASGVGQQAALW